MAENAQERPKPAPPTTPSSPEISVRYIIHQAPGKEEAQGTGGIDLSLVGGLNPLT